MDPRLGSTGEFCWMDLKTHDVPGTADFFSGVLGWRFATEEVDGRPTTTIFIDDHRIGGMSDLANPVYPPGTPAHIAYYLAVDDVDGATATAVRHGARLVVGPFDAGGLGRVSTLVDPVGAAFSLWQAREFSGWAFPPNATGVPERMVLACADPVRAQEFYQRVLGTPPRAAEFAAESTSEFTAPRWELALTVADLDRVAARARGRGVLSQSRHPDRPTLRLSSPEGLTFRLRSPDPRPTP
ncbi:VOC family protein [Saccharothrix coeruleofusca]|uniref:VOC domain-containing protein n=1 Tax=Saccharothrix coeruleofusca TaxID=33919 RepID=A0A918ARF6_9PSEU|nr:VOC family protein [Saccharothrix coeruleofusca]MBP2335785.1 putative enzyme related to lactoylglutathione lyase [Saccharothrix coeruleofusca]GGP75162.1 hypothetical protein GCM10010185_55960 [Saccharothrix coeruleofusca]